MPRISSPQSLPDHVCKGLSIRRAPRWIFENTQVWRDCVFQLTQLSTEVLSSAHRHTKCALERTAKVCEEHGLQPVPTDIRELRMEIGNPSFTTNPDSCGPSSHSELWSSRYHAPRLCLLRACARWIYCLLPLRTQVYSMLQTFRNVISQFSSVYSDLFPLLQHTVNTQDPVLSCVIVVLGDSSNNALTKAVMPVNRVQPLLRCSPPVRGSHGATLLLGLQTITDISLGRRS